jgi:hypothetical protein
MNHQTSITAALRRAEFRAQTYFGVDMRANRQNGGEGNRMMQSGIAEFSKSHKRR